ncbi:hypothetical protein CC2G_013057 [Coprinopsis cinerea AmutBmut pab1-1]|nr:hypothetical protein CC2G_013057 [Coprinopsis cinerea AmutBmut pab1-1]
MRGFILSVLPVDINPMARQTSIQDGAAHLLRRVVTAWPALAASNPQEPQTPRASRKVQGFWDFERRFVRVQGLSIAVLSSPPLPFFAPFPPLSPEGPEMGCFQWGFKF